MCLTHIFYDSFTNFEINTKFLLYLFSNTQKQLKKTQMLMVKVIKRGNQYINKALEQG